MVGTPRKESNSPPPQTRQRPYRASVAATRKAKVRDSLNFLFPRSKVPESLRYLAYDLRCLKIQLNSESVLIPLPCLLRI